MKRIEIGQIEPGMVLAHDVYADSEEYGHAKIATKATVLNQKLIDRMVEYGVEIVPIEGKDESLTIYDTNPYLADAPRQKPLLDEKLKQSALSNLKHFFSMAESADDEATHMAAAIQVVKELDVVVDELVDTILSDDGLVNINDLKSYDEYTYHHSLSVSVLSIAIAKNLGLDEADINRVGRAAIMHDIGKTSIPVELINKPSRLDTNEFETIKTHSTQGAQYLIKNAIGKEDLWQGVLHHHEKMDGSGYPNGLKNEEIPLISRIIAVADVYDALTSYRPYRTPMTPAEAVEFIMGNIGVQFDYAVVIAFLRKLELYPVGSFIQLSNGKNAVVLNNENPLRPVVRLLDNGETLNLYTDRGCLNLTIAKPVDINEIDTQE